MAKQLLHLVMSRLLMLLEGAFVFLIDGLALGPPLLTFISLVAAFLMSLALLLRLELVLLIVLAV